MRIPEALLMFVREKVVCASPERMRLKDAIKVAVGKWKRDFGLETTVDAVTTAWTRWEHRPSLHQGRSLTDIQEKRLAISLLLMASVNAPCPISELPDVILKMFNVQVDRTWKKAFFMRHKDIIKVMKCNILPKSYCSDELLDNTDTWIKIFREVLTLDDYKDFEIIAYDESQLLMDDVTKDVVVGRRSIAGNTKGGKLPALGTILPFVSAAGKLHAVFYILKKKKEELQEVNVFLPVAVSSQVPRFYVWNETGMVNNDLMVKIMREVLKVLDGQRALFMCDQYASHKCSEVMSLFDGDRYAQMLFVANLSLAMDPLDDTIFGVLQKSWRCDMSKQMFALAAVGGSVVQSMFAALYEAESKAFTKTNIQTAFLRTGMWPFNADVIRERAGKVVGTAPLTHVEQVHQVVQDARKILKKAGDIHEHVRKSAPRYATSKEVLFTIPVS